MVSYREREYVMRGNAHVAAKKLDLESDNRLCEPDHGEDAAENQLALVVARVDREQEGQEQAE